jgi:DNA polymerase/3'-5' exonuclease PolX
MKLDVAQRIGADLVEKLSKFCQTGKCIVVGSTRRLVSDPGDLELLCIPNLSIGRPALEFGKPGYASYFDAALASLITGNYLTPTNRGTICRKFFINSNHAKLQIWVVHDPTVWGVCSTVYTGPAEFSKWVVTQRQFGGALPDGHRITDGWKLFDSYSNHLPMLAEGEFFEFLSLGWVDPENRHARMRKF